MAGYNIDSRDPLIGPYAGVKLLRSAFVIGLREMYKMDSKYTYAEDERGMTNTEQSLIEVADTHPFEIQKFPAIVIPSINERDNTFFFGDDLMYPVYIDGKEVSAVRGSPLHMTVNVQARAYSSIERDELTDKTYIYLRTIRDKLAKLGIEARHVTVQSPAEEEFGTRIQYLGNLSINTYSEWYFEDTPVDIDAYITRFRLTLSSAR